ncbi:hypothetical protein SAMN04487894_10345 [Niabella drilacis]|uniref:Uncharacterized protein n=1 Tax=Niabella drilacis (strain DSM 25811 / CCM 8410 / CCUG 62505 / LMG 26954 / E90) TaxID=1285928 RepID=A0A1G6MW51_NIADE|nr:hypothetical protein SAMN04487894_10345 [Niabella drilacis]
MEFCFGHRKFLLGEIALRESRQPVVSKPRFCFAFKIKDKQ